MILAALAAILVLGLATLTYFNARQYNQFASDVQHSYQVESQIARLITALRTTEAVHRAYLLTGDESALADYYGSLPSLDAESRHLGALVTSAAQQRRAEQLRRLVLARRDEMQRMLVDFRRGGLEAIGPQLGHIAERRTPGPIGALAQDMQSSAGQLLREREDDRRHSAKNTALYTLVTLLACMGLLSRAFYLVLREQRNRLRSEGRIAEAYIDLANTLEQSRRLADQLSRLSSLGEMLQSCRHLHEALAVIRTNLPELLPDSAGAVQTLNASQSLVETTTEWGTPVMPFEAVFTPDECLALRRGHPYPMAGAPVALRCKHLHPPEDHPDASYLCMPLSAQGETLGILHVQHPRSFDADTRRLILTIGEQLALAVGNLRLQETLRTQSIRDPLTGLFNRRYLEASLSRELHRAHRRDMPLCVLMVDVDHFKAFNDSHGHEAGDATLVAFAGVLEKTIRAEDIACRYGGEEFTLILPETDAEAALQRAREIRENVAGLTIMHRRERLGPVSCSIGVAVYPVNGHNADDLLRTADQALYRAKQQGRDRVVQA